MINEPTESFGLRRETNAAVHGAPPNVEALYRRYRPAVRSICRRFIADPARVEELTQETFVRALCHKMAFDGRRDPLPWLATIARRLCIDELRARYSATQNASSLRVYALDDAVWDSGDPTADKVIERDERGRAAAHLLSAIETLSHRERRLLWLRNVEDWTYQDIAHADGSTVVAARNVVWRARGRLRRVLELKGMAGSYGVQAALPFVAACQCLLAHVVRLFRVAAKNISDPFRRIPAETTSMLVHSFLGIFVTVASLLTGLVPDRPDVVVPEFAGAMRQPTASIVSAISRRKTVAAPPRVEKAPKLVAPPMSNGYANAREYLTHEFLTPTHDKTPEDTEFSSVAFARDGSIFALGSCFRIRPDCRVLFVSQDGGASWERLSAHLLDGDIIVVPPTYPARSTIFAGGPHGLQRSDDGGRSFRLGSPWGGWAAASPNFGKDGRIFIAGTGVREYDAYTGVTRPVPAAAVAGWDRMDAVNWERSAVRGQRLAFSPSFGADRTFFVADAEAARGYGLLYTQAPVVHRCTDDGGCKTTKLAESGLLPRLRISPRFSRDGILYALTGDGAYLSRDRGRRFVRLPQTPLGAVYDVVIPDSSLFPAGTIFGLKGDRIFRSDDRGMTWKTVAQPQFYYTVGVQGLAVAPSGRMLAWSYIGIACSQDGGRTWAVRCIPER